MAQHTPASEQSSQGLSITTIEAEDERSIVDNFTDIDPSVDYEGLPLFSRVEKRHAFSLAPGVTKIAWKKEVDDLRERYDNITSKITPPTIVFPYPTQLEVGQQISTVAYAYDYLGRDLTDQVVSTGSLDVNVAGTYLLSYSVTDTLGKTTVKSVTVTVGDLPAAPTGLSIEAVLQQTAQFSFDPVPNADKHELNYRVVGAPTWMPLSVSATQTSSIQVAGFPVGAEVEARVRAIQGALTGPWSNTVSVRLSSVSTVSLNTTPFNVLSEVGEVVGRYRTNIANATWQLTGNNAADFLIQSTTEPDEIEVVTASVLSAGMKFFAVRATSQNNTQLFAEQSQSLTVANNAPALIGSSPNSTSNLISWTQINNATTYALDFSVDGSTGWQNISDQLTGTSYTHANRTAGESLFYRIRAQRDAQSTPNSAVISITTLLATPTVPGNLVATAQDDTTNQVTWDASSLADTYILNYSLDGATNWIAIGGTLTGTSHLHENLDPETQYYYRVKGRNAEGDSAYSLIVSATTLATVPQFNITEANPNTSISSTDPAGTVIGEYDTDVPNPVWSIEGADGNLFEIELPIIDPVQLGVYRFTGGSMVATETDPAVTMGDFAGNNLVRFNTESASTTTGNYLTISNNQTIVQGAVDSNSYASFQVSGIASLSELTYSVRRGGSATPRGYRLTQVVGGVETTLLEEVVNVVRPTWNDKVVALSINAASAEFRIYPYSPGNTLVLDFENVTLTGTPA